MRSKKKSSCKNIKFMVREAIALKQKNTRQECLEEEE